MLIKQTQMPLWSFTTKANVTAMMLEKSCLSTLELEEAVKWVVNMNLI